MDNIIAKIHGKCPSYTAGSVAMSSVSNKKFTTKGPNLKSLQDKMVGRKRNREVIIHLKALQGEK